MNLDEIICEVIEGYRCRVILDLAGESIGQASIAPHVRAYSPVLALHVARGDVIRVGVTRYDLPLTSDAFGRTVPLLVGFRVGASARGEEN